MLQIGEFSKVCQISVKTLHHYNKIGLLTPAEVDRFTGYRYYRVGQIDDMDFGFRRNGKRKFISRYGKNRSIDRYTNRSQPSAYRQMAGI